MKIKLSDEFYFQELRSTFREEGVPTVWVVFKSGGEYDTSYEQPLCVVGTKEEACNAINELYKEREPIIPKHIFKEAEESFDKKVYELSQTDISDEELDDFQCSPDKYYHSIHPEYSLEDWRHDISIDEDYDFGWYYAQEIHFQTKYGNK